ncbi:phosphoribosyl-AMP cyclohydrolase [Thiothrix subterranea]|uniref:phosphoribosyl-AMP cyclohydrolase n=1 Tax=Thiothrix subterranea TaxID=2735563 RepID=UPI00192ACCFF|nr:phosphoribosyl-AMP cyclohydrolase [Thiothrix subterranea]QQZ27638.1 phosphoribosyl-AMP cyclohydrolase [Thiothrix subterranea]
MSKAFFQSIEPSPCETRFPLDTVLGNLAFNEQGLIPVITQQYDTGKVLMMAWMNAESIRRTLTTGAMTYWSRSRQAFWVKGESSGNTQTLKLMRIDCDGDALLCQVDQQGGASCHTLRSNCFYFEVDTVSSNVVVNESMPL